MAAYHASAHALDDGIGQVMQALEANNLADSTLVVCTTDHGIAFPAMKCNLTDHGIGVMLIMRGPNFHGGRLCEALVSQIDIFPTLCDLLDIEPPTWLQGRSFLPLIRGECEHINEAVFAEVTFHAAYEPMRAVRTTRYKYIRRFDGRNLPVLSNIDDSPGKTAWLAQGLSTKPLPEHQLFDLLFDPQEMNNLATDETHQVVLAEMQTRLNNWMTETDDPLLSGPVQPPAGAHLNHINAISPKEPTHAYPLH